MSMHGGDDYYGDDGVEDDDDVDDDCVEDDIDDNCVKDGHASDCVHDETPCSIHIVIEITVFNFFPTKLGTLPILQECPCGT